MVNLIVKISPEDKMQMQAIVMDADAEEALLFVKILLNRLDASERQGMKSHLDK